MKRHDGGNTCEIVDWYSFINFCAKVFTFSYYCVVAESFSILAFASNPSTTIFRSLKRAGADKGRATRTISQPGFNGERRMISRNRRLTLFLTTALPTLLPIEKPHRDRERPFGSTLKTIRLETSKLPLKYTSEYCSGLVRYSIPPVAPSELCYVYTTVNRLRPLSRLSLRTSRPPRELILLRNPCSRFRGIFLG